jgi:hypothetical protein
MRETDEAGIETAEAHGHASNGCSTRSPAANPRSLARWPQAMTCPMPAEVSGSPGWYGCV